MGVPGKRVGVERFYLFVCVLVHEDYSMTMYYCFFLLPLTSISIFSPFLSFFLPLFSVFPSFFSNLLFLIPFAASQYPFSTLLLLLILLLHFFCFPFLQVFFPFLHSLSSFLSFHIFLQAVAQLVLL